MGQRLERIEQRQIQMQEQLIKIQQDMREQMLELQRNMFEKFKKSCPNVLGFDFFPFDPNDRISF